ncbi:CBM96 family carbohydrate-binding protein [Zobellia uliginosa]|uniref:CBM96 family carbohydrate-binding protein n=1 Tax=Zobellia uliginosa TaxID=143224 RepID=UPI0026E3ADC0|nr:DNRLRE domain-containing protein [Zobellia uliginosa]MDO6518575.1 DNRLRE domain-containing protein [Zobellia uliginosa]
MKNHIIKFTKPVLLAAVFIGGVYSCEIQENFEYQESGIDGKLEISAWEFIKRDTSLSMFESAIVRAELQDFFSDSETRTFIAPTNTAFSEYLETNSYASIDDVPLPILRNALKYHIVNDKVLFTDPKLFENNKPLPYSTENGQTMYLSHNSNFIGLINEGTSKQWEIYSSNIEPLGDVVHVVNSIVYFSAPSGDLNVPDPTVKTDTIFPIHDTYVNGGSQSGANFGSDVLLKVKNVDGNGDYDRKAFLMFDLNDFDEEGVITDVKLEIAVKFTHAKGVALDLYAVQDTLWNEMGLTFDNATFPTDDPIASLTTTKVSAFSYDLTDYVTGLGGMQRVAFMLDGEAGTNETDEFGSKENTDFNMPMLIATLGSGNSFLELEKNNGFTVNTGEAFVWNSDVLEISGASNGDIIYTVEGIPQNGWLIKGAQTLQVGDKFTQQDIDLMNLVYINNGSGSADQIDLSAKDRVGSVIEPFTLEILIQ